MDQAQARTNSKQGIQKRFVTGRVAYKRLRIKNRIRRNALAAQQHAQLTAQEEQRAQHASMLQLYTMYAVAIWHVVSTLPMLLATHLSTHRTFMIVQYIDL